MQRVLWIAALHAIERRGCERGLDRQHGVRVGRRAIRRRAGEREDPLDSCRKFFPEIHRSIVGLQVVLTIGQAEAALIEVGDLLRRVAEDVGLRAEAEQRGNPHRVQMRGEHRREVGGDRRETLRFDLRLVHAGRVVPGRLRAITVGAGRLQDATQDCQIPLLHLRDAPVRSAVRRDWVFRHPAAARELVEIDARIGFAIERLDVDAFHVGPSRLSHRQRRRSGDRNERQGENKATHVFLRANPRYN